MFWTKICVPQPAEPNVRTRRHELEPPFFTHRAFTLGQEPHTEHSIPKPPKGTRHAHASRRKQSPTPRQKLQAWKQIQTSKGPGHSFGKPPKKASRPVQKAGERPRRRYHGENQIISAAMKELQNMHTMSSEKQQQHQTKKAARKKAQQHMSNAVRPNRRNTPVRPQFRPHSAPVYSSAGGQATLQRARLKRAKADAKAHTERERLGATAAEIKFGEMQHNRTKSAVSRMTFDRVRPTTEYLKHETIAAVNGLHSSLQESGGYAQDEPKLRWETRPLHRLEYVQHSDIRPTPCVMPCDGTHWREGELARRYAPP
jgi:hypothetical protein